MLKKLVIGLGLATLAALGGSLIHPFGPAASPGKDRPIFDDATIDPKTLAIFERACQNCHSERTEWPWYAHLAPVSWMIARDVHQARAHVNMSNWRSYSTEDRIRLLSEIGSAVRNRAMPLPRYLLLHPEARISSEERQQIYQWTRTERRRLSMASTFGEIGAIR